MARRGWTGVLMYLERTSDLDNLQKARRFQVRTLELCGEPDAAADLQLVVTDAEAARDPDTKPIYDRQALVRDALGEDHRAVDRSGGA